MPQIELLACTKIFSKRQKDLADLEKSSILDLCDLKKLRKMIEEYKSYLPNPSDPNLNLNHLKERLEMYRDNLQGVLKAETELRVHA